MKVLVDTSVWSIVLRRVDRRENAAIVNAFGALIDDGLIAIVGPVRQELLSGIREKAQFDHIRDELRGFLDIDITVNDYETAASFYNACRSRGIQGSATDFLICAIAVRHDFSIFTTDDDFTRYAKILPIALYAPAR
jgi:predicted nucleic acid-binding protein